MFFHDDNEPDGRLRDLIKERRTLVKVEPNDFVAGDEDQDAFIGKFRYGTPSGLHPAGQALRTHGGVDADMDTLVRQSPA